MRALHKVLLLLAAAGTSVWFGRVSMASSDPLEIHFLSVGQGDCTVIQHKGVTILIDAGPKSDHFDAGERVISPKLRALGVDKIDLVILTHPDMDHIGGLAGISQRFTVSMVLVPSHFSTNTAILEQITSSRIQRSNLISISDGQQLRVSELVFHFLLPKWDSALPDNEGSLVSQVFLNSKPIAVLSGDLGSEGEIGLLGEITNGSPIVMAGHHGSAGSTSAAWLRDANARIVVISCGANNSYGHPAQETLNRISLSKTEILRTDSAGDIGFRVQNGKIERIR